MNRFLTLETSFSALHEHEGHRLHGHRFHLEATIPWSAASKDPSADLAANLAAIVAELHETNLAVMMPGAAYDVTGLAAHFYERLAGIYRNLERVSVDAVGEGRGTAERSRP